MDWTAIIVAFVTAAGGTIVGFFLNEFKASRSEQRALKILLRRELREQAYYWLDQNHITSLGLQEFMDTVGVYTSLVGKNDFINTLVKQVTNLEIIG